DTFTLSFDYKIAHAWDNTQRGYEVFAVNTGGSVAAVGSATMGTSTPTNATRIHNAILPIATNWTTVSVNIPVAAGYDAIVFKLFRDGNPNTDTGIDNLRV